MRTPEVQAYFRMALVIERASLARKLSLAVGERTDLAIEVGKVRRLEDLMTAINPEESTNE